jgi:predicted DNA-binding transcriptional regulator YafY
MIRHCGMLTPTAQTQDTMREIDRLYRYKSLLASRHALSSEELCAALDISIATLKRDMAKLRERLGLPVAYDRLAGGYRLQPGHGRRELPGMWLTPDELVALVTLQQLLAELAPGWLGAKLGPLRERLSHLLHDADLDSLQLPRRIRVVHAGRRHLPPTAFDTVASATLQRRRLWLRHHNRENGQSVERTVSPLQLVHYRDNWYLDAWCHLRGGLRSFAVDAIEQCRLLDEGAEDMDAQALAEATQSSYGIFSGVATARAVLRFSPPRARWVAGEQWHPDQTGAWQADGSYRLELPYSDDRELLGDILKFGPSCEVLSPPELRHKVAKALREAAARYATE